MHLAKRSYSSTAPSVKMFINGQFVDSKSNEFIDVHDPATNKVICRTPKSTKNEMQSAVDCAKTAYEKWRHTSVLTRQTLMLKYQALIRENSVRLFKYLLINKKLINLIKNIFLF